MKKELLEHLEEIYKEKELLYYYELNKKSLPLALVLAFIFSPISYAYIKKWEFVFISLFTLNYFLLGFIIAPLHIYYLFSKAREEIGG
ncbi:MAG: hypothetical protein QXH71_02545 [Candidatus Anstonellaceae archaeon]